MMAATATAVVVVVARSVGEVGGEVGGVVSGEVSGVVGGCVLCLMPTHRTNCTDMYWNKFIRVVSRFGISVWYRLVFSWYFPNRFQRKTW